MVYGSEQTSTNEPKILALTAWAGWWTDVPGMPPVVPSDGSPSRTVRETGVSRPCDEAPPATKAL